LNYLDFENEVILGKEFWDLIGGKGTYEDVLEIYREVGKQKGPDMLDQLALNY
ncbi:TdeIII family type II restriction endonuclease, partial [Candidatus Micrarchaeota archaeon]|nr:TdeIII family type II restriction endonuclease [Candidatus Micrarchaeota archaeon]